MIITPFSVLYSVIFGSIYLLFLRMSYGCLLRYNCYKIVFYFLFLTILRYVFVIDLPLNTSSELLFWVSKGTTLFGKIILDLAVDYSVILLTVNNQIVIDKILLIVWFCVAAVLIIRNLLALHHISKSRKKLPISHGIHAEKILQQIQEEMHISFDISIIQSSQVRVPFVTGLQHPIIHLGIKHMEDDELDGMIRHELAHIMFHDNWLKIILHYITLILWWNPFIRVLPAILDDTCEYRCDSFVTKYMKDGTKLNYASMINKYSLNEAVSALDYTKSAYAVNKGNDYIYQRIMTFLKPQSLKLYIRCLLLTVLVLFSVCFFVFSVPTLRQRNYMPSMEEKVTANASNSYLLKKNDGSYSLFTLGMLISSDITDISHYNIPIKEESE